MATPANKIDVNKFIEKAEEFIALPPSEPKIVEFLCSYCEVSQSWYFKQLENPDSPVQFIHEKLQAAKSVNKKIYGYMSLFHAAKEGNVSAAEKVIKLLGTNDERKALNGIVIDGELTTNQITPEKLAELLKNMP